MFQGSQVWKRLSLVCLPLDIVFSSPEPKAQVSFSDQSLSVVRRRRRRRRWRWRCYGKLFTFSSSLEPLGQFHLNLAQSILG